VAYVECAKTQRETIMSNEKLDLTDAVLVWVMSEHSARKVFLQGLFVAARRYIGYSPVASSHPFITSKRAYGFSKLDRPEELAKEFGTNRYWYTDWNTKTSKGIFALSLHVIDYIKLKDLTTFADWFFGEDKEPYSINDKEFMTQFCDEYWQRMLDYASKNRYFNYSEF
jgi:hypothetical protein